MQIARREQEIEECKLLVQPVISPETAAQMKQEKEKMEKEFKAHNMKQNAAMQGVVAI